MTVRVASASIALEGFRYDAAQAELLTDAGERVRLRPRSREVLRCLARAPGQLVTKDQLMQAVWPDVVVTDDSLVQCIAELRRALNDDDHQIIQTEPRRGYRLVPCTTVAASEGTLEEAEAFTQDIRFASTGDGVRIAYASAGDGRVLVRAAHWMTHLDWDWRSATFGPRIRALASKFRLVRYDGRGYGLSDWTVDPASLEQAVTDLDAVVTALGLSRFSLLGASGGAPAAIRFAALNPHRVERLVLLGGFARGMLHRGERSIPQANCDALLRLIEAGWGQDNPAYRQLITSLMWPGADAAQMASFNQLQRMSCSPAMASALLLRIAHYDVTEDLPKVRCPTLVLHSPHDSRVPFEEGRLLASLIPGARLEPFDSPNHTPLVGEPAFGHVQRLIEGFLREADDGALPAIHPMGPVLRAVGGVLLDAAPPKAAVNP